MQNGRHIRSASAIFPKVYHILRYDSPCAKIGMELVLLSQTTRRSRGGGWERLARRPREIEWDRRFHRMIRKFATIFSFLVLTAGLVQTNDSRAGVPTDQIRATVGRVLIILNDRKLNSDGAKEARRSELSKAIFPRFDFEEMAKRSLGSEWGR